jgi:tetratricopeptide (TPR) repeat protein
MEPALELLKQGLAIAQSSEDAALLHAAHFQMGQTLFWMGQFMPAQTHFELSCSLYDPAPYPSHGSDLPGFCKGVHSLMLSGTAAWYLGFPEQARDRVERALSLARQQSDPFCVCLALAGSSRVDVLRGETIAASKFADAMFHLAHEQGFRGFLAMATAQRGAALVAGGHAEEGITQLREGLDGSGGAFEVMRTLYLAALAEGYGLAGRVDEGLAVLAEAMALAESTGVCINEAELNRLKGELTLKRPEAGSNSERKEEAETFFRRAIEVARRQSAKSRELRATMSLARLLDKQGRRDEARAMLAEIYGWFTEGFDTADLKDAKALLEELGT